MRNYGNMKLKPGWSLDITQLDPEHGLPWDFSDKKKAKKLWDLVKHGKPYCIICSPPCTMYSMLHGLNRRHWTQDEYDQKMARAREHIRICMNFCQVQLREGRYFVFEHPAEAKSWKLPEVEELVSHERVHASVFDMCQFGLTAKDDDGVVRPVRNIPAQQLIAGRWLGG